MCRKEHQRARNVSLCKYNKTQPYQSFDYCSRFYRRIDATVEEVNWIEQFARALTIYFFSNSEHGQTTGWESSPDIDRLN